MSLKNGPPCLQSITKIVNNTKNKILFLQSWGDLTFHLAKLIPKTKLIKYFSILVLYGIDGDNTNKALKRSKIITCKLESVSRYKRKQ